MRVRTLVLRLLAGGLTVAWALTAGLILTIYRPGGPLDLLVGVAAGLPIAVAAAALVSPPVARGSRSFAATVWLGLAALLLLAPSIGALVGQLQARGPQTLIPSLEVAYPWFLALLATSLFTGFGIARRRLGGRANRRRRLVRGTAIGLVLSVVVASAFGGVAIANEIALRDRVVAASRFGPTDPTVEPPECDVPVRVGPGARVALVLSAEVDGRALGTVDVRGARDGRNFRWLAFVATNRQLGQHGAAAIGASGWSLAPGTGWRPVPRAEVAGGELDLRVREILLDPALGAVAEMRGIDVFEGARARHCRIAVGGGPFAEAFPQVRWLVGDADLDRWRGELDYWVFLDGQLGRLSGSVSGEASQIVPGALQATVEVTMIATDRTRPPRVVAPRS